MRKRFARILCGSLSVMLFCGQGMAYAGTVPAENETGKGRFFMLPNAKNTESKAEYGCIGVNLVIPQDIDLQQEFQVSLNGEQVKKVTLDSGNGQRNETVLFENLAPGNYTVEIQASGYLPYIQKIEVESYNYKIAVAPNDENETEEIVYTGEMESNIKQQKISNQGGIIAFRYAINNLSNYISNENEEVDYGKLLQLTNIKEENIKTTISFDFIITLTTNRKYQTNIQIDIPAKEVIEKGVDGIELTEFNNLIFKRIEN